MTTVSWDALFPFIVACLSLSKHRPPPGTKRLFVFAPVCAAGHEGGVRHLDVTGRLCGRPPALHINAATPAPSRHAAPLPRAFFAGWRHCVPLQFAAVARLCTLPTHGWFITRRRMPSHHGGTFCSPTSCTADTPSLCYRLRTRVAFHRIRDIFSRRSVYRLFRRAFAGGSATGSTSLPGAGSTATLPQRATALIFADHTDTLPYRLPAGGGMVTTRAAIRNALFTALRSTLDYLCGAEGWRRLS